MDSKCTEEDFRAIYKEYSDLMERIRCYHWHECVLCSKKYVINSETVSLDSPEANGICPKCLEKFG